MSSCFHYAAVCSTILAIVLAVAREVPLLNLLMPPEVDNELLLGFAWYVPVLLLALGGGIYSGIVGPELMAATWLGGLAYFWWTVSWHLRELR